MTTDFKTKCRGPRCGREVLMRVVDGKPAHPYDAPTLCEPCNGQGSITVHTRNLFGESTETRACKPCKGSGKRWKSHFATCPDAEMFRRPKDGADATA